MRKIRWAIYEDIYVKNECTLEDLYKQYKDAFDKWEVSFEDLERRFTLFQWDTKRRYYKEMHQQPSLMEDINRNVHTSATRLNDLVTELIEEFIETHHSEVIHSIDDLKKLTSALKDLQDSKLKLLSSLNVSSTEVEDKRAKARKLSPEELAAKVKQLEKLVEQ